MLAYERGSVLASLTVDISAATCHPLVELHGGLCLHCLWGSHLFSATHSDYGQLVPAGLTSTGVRGCALPPAHAAGTTAGCGLP